MRMRRVLALLCALFCIWSSLFSAAFAVEIPPDLDDLGIDPWGDLGLIQEMPEPAPTAPIGEPDQLDPVELEPEEEGGVSVFSLGDDGPYQFINVSSSVGAYFNANGLTPTTSSAPYPSNISFFSASVTDTPSIRDLLSKGLYCTGTEGFTFGGTFVLGFVSGSAGHAFTVRRNLSTPINVTASKTVISVVGSVKIGACITAFSSVGGSSGSKGGSISTSLNRFSFPFIESVQFVLNGKPYGDPVPINGDTVTFNNTFDISSLDNQDITKYELWINTKVGSQEVWRYNYTTGASPYGRNFSAGLLFDDSALTITFSDASSIRHEETKGLLATIIQWLTSIRDTIGSVFTAIVELPGRIASALIDGLKSLFIPSEEDLNGLKDQYETLLSERLGFIWQAGEWITSFGSDLLSALSGGLDAEFVFPGVGFDMNGEHYQLIEQQTVDFDANGIVTVIRPFVGTIVALVVVAACVNLFHDMVGALISGKSYFDFLKGGGG